MGASCTIRTDFEIISQECSSGDPFQKLFAKFDLSINMALVNRGFLHYMDMKKFIKKIFSETAGPILK